MSLSLAYWSLLGRGGSSGMKQRHHCSVWKQWLCLPSYSGVKLNLIFLSSSSLSLTFSRNPSFRPAACKCTINSGSAYPLAPSARASQRWGTCCWPLVAFVSPPPPAVSATPQIYKLWFLTATLNVSENLYWVDWTESKRASNYGRSTEERGGAGENDGLEAETGHCSAAMQSEDEKKKWLFKNSNNNNKTLLFVNSFKLSETHTQNTFR